MNKSDNGERMVTQSLVTFLCLDITPRETASMKLSCAVALGERKFNIVQAFLHQHIGRSDLMASVICPFNGFSKPEDETFAHPTREQFYGGGRPSFVTGDHSVAFGSNPRLNRIAADAQAQALDLRASSHHAASGYARPRLP